MAEKEVNVMPRVALTDAQRERQAKSQIRSRFERKLSLYRALYQLSEREICAMLGMSQGTFIARKKDPDQFTVAEIKRLCDILHWSGAVRAYIWYAGADPDQLACSDKPSRTRSAPIQGNVSAM